MENEIPQRVLLVSSSSALRRMLMALLRKDSEKAYHCDEETSYAKGFERQQNTPYDLVLLGDQAENGSFIAFLEKLQESFPWHPILFLHGGEDKEAALEALRHGAQDALEVGSLSSAHLQLAIRRIRQIQDLQRQNQHFARELERSNRELTQFAHSVSHDLREPLRKVRSFGALLQESMQGRLDDEETYYLDRMVNGAERMEQMIHEVLEYSRAGRSHTHANWISLDEILQAVREDLDLVLKESSASIQLEGSLPRVFGESIRLHQLIQNILANAIKYRRLDTPLHIKLVSQKETSSSLRLDIIDNGKGFDPTQSESLFGLFRRLRPSDDKTEGYGIGLALCRRIAESLGGNLTATGVPGQGATFTLHLPNVQWTNNP